MCTIVVLHRAHPRWPLAVVANRDELVDRPATPPRVLASAPRVVGGLDLVSGGTWMGANEHGLFVGLTNQRTPEPPDRTRRSRGPLVTELLGARDAAGVEVRLRGVDARELNPFNLVFGALGDVRVAYARDGRAAIEVEAATEPVTVLPNDRLRSPDFPKIARAEGRAAEALAAPDPEAALARILADHEKPPADRCPPHGPDRFAPEILRELQALCVHLPFYGTVSATVMLFGEDGRLERYLFASGPPCVTPFEDVTELLRPAG